MGLWIFGTLDDIVDAPRIVRGLNQPRSLAIVPSIGADRAGVALAGTF